MLRRSPFVVRTRVSDADRDVRPIARKSCRSFVDWLLPMLRYESRSLARGIRETRGRGRTAPCFGHWGNDRWMAQADCRGTRCAPMPVKIRFDKISLDIYLEIYL